MTLEQKEFNNCPECKIGKLKPTGGAATSLDVDTNRVTNQYREYECDNCGYPKGGKQKVVIVNEQIGISISKTTADNLKKDDEDKKRGH